MATNRRGDGGSITYNNTGAAISSGDVVVMGETLGVALVDIAATTGVGEVAIEGEFTLPAASAAVVAVGETVMWDVTGTEFDDNAAIPAVGDVSGAAIATVAKAALETTVTVKLTNPGTVT